MQTIGLLGGMSWESTAGYYRDINRGVAEKLGGLHSAQISLYSIDFSPIERLQHEGDWQGVADALIEAALKVQSAGADFLLICTNTMHKVADQIEAALQIPLLNIADATAEVLVAEGVKKAGLLGTAFTMEEDFYSGRLKQVSDWMLSRHPKQTDKLSTMLSIRSFVPARKPKPPKQSTSESLTNWPKKAQKQLFLVALR